MLAAADSEWEQLIDKIELLPPLNPIAGILMSRLSDEFITIQEVIALVKQDSAITGRLIKLANSAIYQWPTPLESIDAAVTRVLGLDTTAAVSLGIAFSESISTKACPNLDQVSLWTETLLLAKCTKRIVSDQLGSDELGAIAYTGTLLSNLGILALATLEPVRLSRCLDKTPELSVEQSIAAEFQCNHRHLAGQLATSWSLPTNLLPLITLESTDTCPPYTEITQIAVSVQEVVAKFVSDEDNREDWPKMDVRQLQTSVDELLSLLNNTYPQCVAEATALTGSF